MELKLILLYVELCHVFRAGLRLWITSVVAELALVVLIVANALSQGWARCQSWFTGILPSNSGVPA